MRYTVLIGFVMVLLIGCVPEELEVKNVPKAESKLVVSTILVPDQTIILALTQSFGALDGGEESNPSELLSQVLVPDAQVTIQYDGGSIPLYQTFNGFYTSIELLQEVDKEYTLSVFDPASGRSVSAVTKLNEISTFDSVSVRLEATSLDTFPRIKFKFQDNPGEDYYMINVHKIVQRSELYESFIDNQPYTYLIDNADVFDGGMVSGEFLAIHNEDYDPLDTLVVSLSNISIEYYSYLKTRDDERLTIDFLSEPFNLPSNVSNGYGFFNLHVPNPRTFVLDSIN